MEEDNIKGLQKKADQFESQYNKLKVEFKNYIETSRRNEELKKKELQSDAAKKLLVFADSLSRMSVSVNKNSCDTVRNTGENFQQNIDVMYQQLLSVSGLVPVNPGPGDKFDDTLHMAVGLEYGSRYPENTVFRVIRKGYLRENILIRPAEVIISKSPREWTKSKKTGMWEQFTSWASPARRRFAGIDQQINGLENARSEDNKRLHHEIDSVKELISQLIAGEQEAKERIRVLEETVGQLTEELDEAKKFISLTDLGQQETNERIRALEETVGKPREDLDDSPEFISSATAEMQETGEDTGVLGETNGQIQEESDNSREFIVRSGPTISGFPGNLPPKEEIPDKSEPECFTPRTTIPLQEPGYNRPGRKGPVPDEDNNKGKDTYDGN